ncbi:hypothetical protein E4O03_00805 [Treponema sp. OMZ 792]|uniref:DUF6175 family protein n=1 Tax=unclassified Treponema TaxID=2638727 RepID=UPI0020A31F86|nr:MULTISPECIES: DUF6175 family protein [unclassified Treponema]UTC75301.1 hypothetical protein E4O03_00805 [Treponema sp. OMZ 792]UTC78908.1 hypothetical protein E4O04_13220 [Treponema sp. OMZ 799]UTC79303.1 hypothetical protein E4O07_00815 [Treponema sp. OMZ 798]
MRKISLFLFLSVPLFFFSCASIEDALDVKRPAYTETKEYTSMGEDVSFLQAINKAKVGAIRQGVIDIIGPESEKNNYERIREELYNTEYPNKYVVNEKMDVLQKSKTGDVYIIKIKIPVKMNEVSAALSAAGIFSQKTSNNKTMDDLVFGDGQLNENPNSAQKPKDADLILKEAQASGEGKKNLQFLNNYIENMTYMVFDAEEANADRFLLKAAVETGNAFLLKQGYRAIDSKEVEKLKKDQAVIYQESSEEGMSAIQLIAQKLNADVYMEIDAVTEGGYESNGYYGSAKITLKIFNPSTGELLGAVPYTSQKTFSRVSSYDAQSNAIQSAVNKALPMAIDQAKILLAKAYSRGIRYEVIINETPDSKSMSRLRKALSENLNDIKTLYQSSAQTKYAVSFFGTIDDLEAVIYDAADSVPGFENIKLVMLRGKTLTFKSGF